MEKKAVDKHGHSYKRSLTGWKPDMGLLGQKQNRTIFGNPNVRYGLFGMWRVGRTTSGEDLYEARD